MIDCEFLYFDGDKTSKNVTGTKTKPDERIALEYFEETIDKWVCTSIVPENTRYRIRREMGSVAVRYPDKGIDWEQRRYEIARDMMACSTRNFIGAESRAAEAIRYADELIKRLKAST